MNHELAKQINDRIIDFILASPLNIDIIPDDIEREMYEKILDVIVEEIINDSSCFDTLKSWICFCKKNKEKNKEKKEN